MWTLKKRGSLKENNLFQGTGKNGILFTKEGTEKPKE
jgi:hypothetical protein